MSNFRRTALASVINLALLGIPDAQAAKSEPWKNASVNWKVVWQKWINWKRV